ncbi:DUF4189 domain-containing protein [Methylocapsa sp. S129]|uniref:DUF4189 domain-containing protein n=1 Tax=Methylocapsa sp. S129 TaxID=1641869 RepID=UPI00131C387C|nr:DUF4189 domain-containing protein [Methylocapsa sp. S129]
MAADYAWGAISVDASASTTEPAYGVGGADTEAEAVETAQKFCVKAGGKGCKSMVTYQQCGAFASNGHDAGWGKSPTKKGAEDGAMSACQKGDCKIVISDCN